MSVQQVMHVSSPTCLGDETVSKPFAHSLCLSPADLSSEPDKGLAKRKTLTRSELFNIRLWLCRADFLRGVNLFKTISKR